MKVLKTLSLFIILMASIPAESQTITPASLLNLLSIADDEEKLITVIEKKGYDYYDEQQDEEYQNIIYSSNRDFNKAPRWVSYYKLDDKIIFIEYQTLSKSEYLAYKDYLSKNSYKITKNLKLDDGTPFKVYSNGKIQFMVFQKPKDDGMKYSFSVKRL